MSVVSSIPDRTESQGLGHLDPWSLGFFCVVPDNSVLSPCLFPGVLDGSKLVIA